jgi:hypothetical protein
VPGRPHLRTVAAYLALRRRLGRDWEERDVRALLAELDRGGPRLPADGLEASLRVAERLAARLPWPNTCLFRALARYGVCVRAGVDVELRLGVRGRDDDLEGHAWVLRAGRPWLEPEPPPHRVTLAHRR